MTQLSGISHDPEARQAAREPLLVLLLGAAYFVFACVVTLSRIDVSWIPHDDGTLALAAQLVLRGEWPHVDFDTPYSGGLAFFHALTFTLLSEDLVSMRYAALVLLVVAMGAASVVMARRHGWGLSLVVVGTGLWGFAIYPAAMPSLYQVALAIGTFVCIDLYMSKGRAWVLALAGVLTGIAILVKITGVFTLAAVLLVLGTGVRQLWLRALLLAGPVLGALAYVSSEFLVVRLVVFIGPIALVAWIAWGHIEDRRDVRLRHIGLVVGSALLPVTGFLIASAANGGVWPVVEGWFVVPRLRFDYATSTDGGLTPSAAVALLLVPILIRYRARAQLIVAALTVAMVVHALLGDWYVILLAAAILLHAAPLMLAIALVMTTRTTSKVGWVAALAFTALLAFPVSVVQYMLYLVPLTALTALEVFHAYRRNVLSRESGFKVLACCVAIGVVALAGMMRGAVYGADLQIDAPYESGRLALERASLEVEAHDLFYNELIPAVQVVSGGGAIYAGPDLPQIYALAGLPAVSRVFFDFLTLKFTYDQLPELLRQSGSRAVVLNSDPAFSEELPIHIMAELEAMYPNFDTYGSLTLRWSGP